MSYEIKKKLCPLVKKPLSECYCFELNSKNINSAIRYCSECYESCEIYKKQLAQGKSYERY